MARSIVSSRSSCSTGARDRRGRRRSAMRDQRYARQGSPHCGALSPAICLRFSTPAPMARSWPPTTTAARCRPRCSSTARKWSVIRTAPDDRRPAGAGELIVDPSVVDTHPMTGLLIAFEGLDQSGKQTQAERREAHHVSGAAASAGCCRFPTTPQRSARKSRRRCTANASTARTSCS